MERGLNARNSKGRWLESDPLRGRLSNGKARDPSRKSERATKIK